MANKSKTYAEFHYWVNHNNLTMMKGYISDGTQHRYPDFEFKSELLNSLVEGFKSIYSDLLVCEHKYF